MSSDSYHATVVAVDRYRQIVKTKRAAIPKVGIAHLGNTVVIDDVRQVVALPFERERTSLVCPCSLCCKQHGE